MDRVKNPDKVRAGQASARARWGETRRILRLDELTDPQRRLVTALVESLKTENAERAS